MAKKRHTAEQIIGKLREAEVELSKGQPVSKVACVTADELPTLARLTKPIELPTRLTHSQ